jgi:hypothetical protein
VGGENDNVLPFDNPAERLFRSIAHGWVNGIEVTSDAIDLQGCSCNRECLAPDPYSATDLVTRPNENGVASITVEDAHGIVERPKGDPWEFYPAHCPEHGNEAHCEIRVHRRGSSNLVDKISSHGQRLQVRAAIAKRMKVVIVPIRISAAEHEDEFG